MTKKSNQKNERNLKRIKFEVGQEIGISGKPPFKEPEKENKN